MSPTAESVTFSELLASRASTYELLGRLFRKEVDAPLLDDLKKLDCNVAVDNADIDEGYALWRSFQQNLTDQTLVDLAVDYVKTFIGTGKTSSGAAYPYESVYTSPMRLLMQEARDQVLELYAAEGIGKAPNFVDPEDHIALELSFMVFLNKRCHELFTADKPMEALEYLKKQQSFLTDHLNRWAPTFCNDIPRFSQSNLYLGLAKITKGFLEVDAAALAELIEEVQRPAA